MEGLSIESAVKNMADLSDGDKWGPKLLRALEELSMLPEERKKDAYVSARERKQKMVDLKSLIEVRDLEKHKEFLKALRNIQAEVQSLHSELSDLNSVCDFMSKNLWKSKQSSRNLIEEISKLESERKKLEAERKLAEAYLSAFQLSADDVKALRNADYTADVLGESFFKVVDKINRIQSNVQVLLKIGHQTTAVEIMDQMSLLQETALEKIYRWAQVRAKHIENPEFSDEIARALSYLEVRLMLLKYVLDEYCTHRRSLLVRSFIDALTGVGNIKGIELFGATDPPRYISDMLAWVHQAIFPEKESLSVMLKSCCDKGKDERIQSCLGNIMDGLVRPVTVRMEQTVLSGLSCGNMNQIDARLQFYISIIKEEIPESQLLASVEEMHTLCHQTLINQIKCQVNAELSELKSPGPDLVPSSVIPSLLGLLQEVLIDTKDSESDDIESLCQLIIVPLVTRINEISSRLSSQDMAVYMCNCLGKILAILENYPKASSFCKSLKGQIESQIDRLSSEQISWLVAQLGIGHIYTILHEKIEQPLSSIPGMDSTSLKMFVNKLDTLISDQDSVLLPQIFHLLKTEQKNIIQQQSFKILIAIYKQVYEAVHKPENQYEDNVLILTPERLEDCLCNSNKLSNA